MFRINNKLDAVTVILRSIYLAKISVDYSIIVPNNKINDTTDNQ